MSTFIAKQLTLILRDKSLLHYSCNHLETSAASVRVLEHLSNPAEALLISFSHGLLNTQLDLTEVAPYVALQFDNQANYLGASLSLGTTSGTFGIITQANQVVLLPFDASLPVEHISRFQLDQSF
jgi:hypothetical protein